MQKVCNDIFNGKKGVYSKIKKNSVALNICIRRMINWCKIGAWKTSLLAQPPLHSPLLAQPPIILSPFLQMEPPEPLQNDQIAPSMSKNAQKRLLKQQRFEAKKAEKKAQMKEHKKREAERKRTEWAEKLASLDEEEREKLIEQRKGMRRERMEKRSEEKGQKLERLQQARANGQNVVIDLEFAHLMTSTELSSLVQQVNLPIRLSVFLSSNY